MEFSIWHEFQDQGVTVLGISSQPIGTIQQFIEDQGITFPVLHDINNTYSHYNLQGGQSPFPRDFIIDTEQIIRFANNEYDPGTMITVIEQLLGDSVSITEDDGSVLPLSPTITAAYPNPFNANITIRYSVVSGKRSTGTTLRVYDVAGRLVEELASSSKMTGEYEVTWNARNVSSGIYIIRLEGETGAASRKVVLLK